MLPPTPQPLPLGTEDPAAIAQSVRDVLAYLQASPAVELVEWSGVVSFPLTLSVSMKRAHFVALTGRPKPDNNATVVEVLGLSFSYRPGERGATIVIDSIDGVAAGDSVTLRGIAVGERG